MDITKGQAVYADGASAIVGDVVSVDEENGVAVVTWRPTTTTEILDDLHPADGAR